MATTAAGLAAGAVAPVAQIRILYTERDIRAVGVPVAAEMLWSYLQRVTDAENQLDRARLSAEDRAQLDAMVQATSGYAAMLLELGLATEQEGDMPPVAWLANLFFAITAHCADSLAALQLAYREQQGEPMPPVVLQ